MGMSKENRQHVGQHSVEPKPLKSILLVSGSLKVITSRTNLQTLWAPIAFLLHLADIQKEGFFFLTYFTLYNRLQFHPPH